MIMSSGFDWAWDSTPANRENRIELPITGEKRIITFEHSGKVVVISINSNVLTICKLENNQLEECIQQSNIGTINKNIWARDNEMWFFVQFASNAREVLARFRYDEADLTTWLSPGGFFDYGNQNLGGVFPDLTNDYVYLSGRDNSQGRITRVTLSTNTWAQSQGFQVNGNGMVYDIEIWQVGPNQIANCIISFPNGSGLESMYLVGTVVISLWPAIWNLSFLQFLYGFDVNPSVGIPFGVLTHASGNSEWGDAVFGNPGNFVQCLSVHSWDLTTFPVYNQYQATVWQGVTGSTSNIVNYARIYEGLLISFTSGADSDTFDSVHILPTGCYSETELETRMINLPDRTTDAVGFCDDGLIVCNSEGCFKYIFRNSNNSVATYYYRGFGSSHIETLFPFASSLKDGDQLSSFVVYNGQLIYAGTGTPKTQQISGTPLYILETRSYTERLAYEGISSFAASSYPNNTNLIKAISAITGYTIAIPQGDGGSILLGGTNDANYDWRYPIKVNLMNYYLLESMALIQETKNGLGINFNGWMIAGYEMADSNASPDDNIDFANFNEFTDVGIKKITSFPVANAGDIFSNQTPYVETSDHANSEIEMTNICFATTNINRAADNAKSIIYFLGHRKHWQIPATSVNIKYFSPLAIIPGATEDYKLVGWKYKENYIPLLLISPYGAEPVIPDEKISFFDVMKPQDSQSDYMLNNP